MNQVSGAAHDEGAVATSGAVSADEPSLVGGSKHDPVAGSAGLPTYFGASTAPLFGTFTPPRGLARDVAVVLCNPFGYEAICTFGAYRYLADSLSEAGFGVLRFDFHGTGDSAGDDDDRERVATWLRDIACAIDEVKTRASVARVVLFGTRLGALLAAEASSDRGDVAGLVLFAPCASGKAFVREVRAFRLMNEAQHPSTAPPPHDGDEAAGFGLSAETASALSRLTIVGRKTAPAPDALVVARDDLPGDELVARKLEALGVRVSWCAEPGYAAMMQDPHNSVAPATVAAAVGAWLSERSRSAAAPVPEPARASADVEEGVRESVIAFGDGGSLFGVVTEAAPPLRSTAAVVFTNAGMVHRVGPNRMYVRMARAWAHLGVTSLRYDGPGIGDSGPCPSGTGSVTYLADPQRSVDAAIDWLKAARGIDRVVIIGLCSGAYVAYHAGLRGTPPAGCVLINPQTFYYRAGDPLDVGGRKNFSASRYYRRAFFRRASWGKALRGEVDFARIAAVFRQRVGTVARRAAAEIIPTLRPRSEGHDIAGELGAIAARGTDLFFVFSEDDPGLEYLASAVGDRRVSKLEARGVLRRTLIMNADHTFTPRASQEALERVLTEYVRRFR